MQTMSVHTLQYICTYPVLLRYCMYRSYCLKQTQERRKREKRDIVYPSIFVIHSTFICFVFRIATIKITNNEINC